MKWTLVESRALQAAAYAESSALLYLLFRSGEVNTSLNPIVIQLNPAIQYANYNESFFDLDRPL